MKIVELIRLESSSEGTFGVLRINKEIFCYTLEPPENDNMKNISNIPSQPYIVEPYESPTHGGTFMVMNVPGRTYVLFHPGNIVEHTEGCIILGQHIGKLKKDRAVLNSGHTFEAFLREMGRQPFKLIITEHY